MLSLLSDIRLAISTGCAENLPFEIDIKTLNTLYMELMSTYIYASEISKPQSTDACDKLRAGTLNAFVRKRKVV